jgi:hypothetical protein
MGFFDANTKIVWARNRLENWVILTFNHGVEGSSPSALTMKSGITCILRVGVTPIQGPGGAAGTQNSRGLKSRFRNL